MTQPYTENARPHNPFDESAKDRQRRMGILAPDGSVNVTAMDAFCKLHAGLFYDDLCDHCADDGAAIEICRGLLALSSCADARRILLALSLQYDAMCRSLPDPIWWIAGNAALVQPFIAGFLQHLATLVPCTEITKECEVR